MTAVVAGLLTEPVGLTEGLPKFRRPAVGGLGSRKGAKTQRKGKGDKKIGDKKIVPRETTLTGK